MFASKKPLTPLKQGTNIFPREQTIQSPNSKFSKILSDKPLMPFSRSIKKDQIIDVNLTHIPPTRLYSPPPVINTYSKGSLKQLTEKNHYIQMIRPPSQQIINQSRQTNNNRQTVTSLGVEASDSCLILGHQSIQGQCMKLRGLIVQKQRQIYELSQKHIQATSQIQKMTMQSKANLYYVQLINDIGQMLGMQSITLSDLKQKIKQLVQNNKQGEQKSQQQIQKAVPHVQRIQFDFQKQLQSSEKSKLQLITKVQQLTQKYNKLQLSKKQQDVEITRVQGQNNILQQRLNQLILQRDNLVMQINSNKTDSNAQTLKNKLKQAENKLQYQSQQHQTKLQQLMNLRVIRQQLESQLNAKNKQCLKLKSEADQFKSQTDIKYKHFTAQLQQLNQFKQMKQLQVEGINKQTINYQLQLDSLRRQLNMKHNQYQSLRKTYGGQISVVQNIKQQLNKQLSKQHQLRISAQEKLRQKQQQLNKYQVQFNSLEKQNIKLTNEIRKLEYGMKGQNEGKKNIEKIVETLEHEFVKQKQALADLKKSFDIQKNQWIRDHNIKIKLEIEPLRQRTNQLQVLCRKYEGIIRELEENNKSRSTLKDARAVVNEISFIAKSEQYSQQKINQIQKFIKDMVNSQNQSSQKLSFELTRSLINMRQQQQRRFNQMLQIKDKQINDCRGKIGELQNRIKTKTSQIQLLNSAVNQQKTTQDSLRKQLQLNKNQLQKYTQQMIKYRSKIQVLERTSTNFSSNHQQLIEQYQRQISNLQSQLSQKVITNTSNSNKQTIIALQNRHKQAEAKYSQNIKKLQNTYRDLINNIKDSHTQGLSELQQIYSKSRQQIMTKNQSLRLQINRLVAQKTTNTQALQTKIKVLQKQVQQRSKMFEQQTQRFNNNGESQKIIRDLKNKLQYQLAQQHKMRQVIQQLQNQNIIIKQNFQSINIKNKQQYQSKLYSLQQLSNKQLSDVGERFDNLVFRNEKLQVQIKNIRQQSDSLKQKNIELNLQIVGRLSSEDINKQILKQRNDTIINIQQQLNETLTKLDKLRVEVSSKNKSELEELILSKSIQLNAEKDIINLRNTTKMQELKIQELNTEISSLQQLKNIKGLQYIQNHNSYDLPVHPLILRRPSSRNGSKPGTAQDRNPRISSVEKTIEATKIMIENNRRATAQIKSHLPNSDPYATIKPVFNQRSGSKSPRSSQRPGSNFRQNANQNSRQFGQVPIVRSNIFNDPTSSRQRQGHDSVMFKRLKSQDISSKYPINYNYSKYYQDNGNNNFTVQFNENSNRTISQNQYRII